MLYRSFSSLDTLRRFKSSYIGRVFIKFGWPDLTTVQKFDVLGQYAVVDPVEFRGVDEIMPDTLVDQIRKS